MGTVTAFRIFPDAVIAGRRKIAARTPCRHRQDVQEEKMDSTTRTLSVVLGTLLAVALAISALMGGVMGPGVMGQGPVGPAAMPGRGWMWGFGMGLGGLVMLTFWGALIVGLVLLVRSMEVGGAQPHTTPHDTLKRRYAAGEITREQYQLMRKDIEQ
jgi:putative membrane protein